MEKSVWLSSLQGFDPSSSINMLYLWHCIWSYKSVNDSIYHITDRVTSCSLASYLSLPRLGNLACTCFNVNNPLLPNVLTMPPETQRELSLTIL